MTDTAVPDIRDADLLDELEAARGSAGFAFVSIRLASRQAERDRLSRLRPSERRRAVTRRGFEEAPADIEDLRHIHSVLAVCGLPYKAVPIATRTFERKQGNMALDVIAGSLRDDQGRLIEQPLPYGPKARLILMHLCSQAIYTRSATIDLNETFTAFVRELGFNDSGGPRGALTAFKHQINALAACTMSLSVWQPGVRVRTEKITPIRSFELWLSDNMHQRALWPSQLTFSTDFYESLKSHALPVNMRAVRAFAGSARTLDAYYWLSYRLTRLKGHTLIPWEALAAQFGNDYTRQRDFRKGFADDVRSLLEVFPKLPVTLSEAGLEMLPADPGVLALPVPRPGRRR
ncbi:MAG: replication protein RepA [Hyphomicrobiaceae bacterium]